MLLVLVEQVGHGEVIELDAHTGYNASLSPTEREFQLVVRLLYEVPVDVNRTLLGVGLHVGIYLFGVEVSH